MIFDNKNWQEKQFNKDQKKKQKKQEYEQKKYINKKRTEAERAQEIKKCSVDLDACKRLFNARIDIERTSAAHAMEEGRNYDRQIERIKTASIGLVLVKDAQEDLRNIVSDADLNATINKMSRAIRMLNGISDNSQQIQTALLKWRVNGMYENSEEMGKGLSEVKLPEKAISCIDDKFVQSLMSGDNFEDCLKRRIKEKNQEEAQKQSGVTEADMDSSNYVNIINGVTGEEQDGDDNGLTAEDYRKALEAAKPY
ncbi:MAG: hypothetical protein ACI4C1_07790 [Lachnospiraceae bacterium]